MQCEQFNQRLNQLLDERRAPECDHDLIGHASECGSCHSVLKIQRDLFQHIQLRPSCDSKPRLPNHAVLWPAVTGIAATFFLMVIANPTSNLSQTGSGPRPTENPTAVAAVQSRQSVASADLISEIMKVKKYLPDEPRIADEQWLDRMSGGIRPLADSMSSTLNVLMKTWPGGGRNRQSPEPQASRRSAVATLA